MASQDDTQVVSVGKMQHYLQATRNMNENPNEPMDMLIHIRNSVLEEDFFYFNEEKMLGKAYTARANFLLEDLRRKVEEAKTSDCNAEEKKAYLLLKEVCIEGIYFIKISVFKENRVLKTDYRRRIYFYKLLGDLYSYLLIGKEARLRRAHNYFMERKRLLKSCEKAYRHSWQLNLKHFKSCNGLYIAVGLSFAYFYQYIKRNPLMAEKVLRKWFQKCWARRKKPVEPCKDETSERYEPQFGLMLSVMRQFSHKLHRDIAATHDQPPCIVEITERLDTLTLEDAVSESEKTYVNISCDSASSQLDSPRFSELSFEASFLQYMKKNLSNEPDQWEDIPEDSADQPIVSTVNPHSWFKYLAVYSPLPVKQKLKRSYTF